MDNEAAKTDTSSISSDLLNGAKKRLGSNFWLSLLGVFFYQNYQYFLHIFYSKKEQYCFKYMKWLTDKYIINGITWEVFWGYFWRALVITFGIFVLSLIFNFLKKFINGRVDSYNEYLNLKKQGDYSEKLKVELREIALKQEKGKLESINEQNAKDKKINLDEKGRLDKLSNQLDTKEKLLESKSKDLDKKSELIDKLMSQQTSEQKRLEKFSQLLDERKSNLDSIEADLQNKLKAIEKEKINLEKYDLPKLLDLFSNSAVNRKFINENKENLLRNHIIESVKIPIILRDFLFSQHMLIDTGNGYYVTNLKGTELFLKFYELTQDKN